jgi:glucose/arabinose dehydrogenase
MNTLTLRLVTIVLSAGVAGLVAPDGALLVSDDDGGAVYRITYGGA